MVHFTSGLTQPVDDIFYEEPNYTIVTGSTRVSVPRADVKDVIVLYSGRSTPPPASKVQPPPPASAPLPTEISPTDTEIPEGNVSDKHWVDEVLSDGTYIILEDNSVWEVDSIDTIYTSLWLSLTEIIIKETNYNGYTFYNMINLDDGESVTATYLGAVELRDSIKGKFNGWKGDTVFPLMNGQILQQASYAYAYNYDYMPDVVLVSTNVAGTYNMIVDGMEETVLVRILR